MQPFGNCTTSALLCLRFLTDLASVIMTKASESLAPPGNEKSIRNISAIPPAFSAYGVTTKSMAVPLITAKLSSAGFPPAVGANFKGLNSVTMNPGSLEPILPSNTYRLYSMRFCPYAERAVLYLARKNIPIEIVNVNLEHLPDWFQAKSPLGRVPTLEYNGKIIYESTVVAEFLDDIFPDSAILPREPYAKAQQKILLERLTPLIDVMYQYFRSTTPSGQKETDQAMHKALRTAESLLQNDTFYGGKIPGYADFMIWPFIERLELITLNRNSQFKYFPGLHYPKMGAYIARMQRVPEVKFATRPVSHHAAYIDSFMKGRPNYDYAGSSLG